MSPGYEQGRTHEMFHPLVYRDLLLSILRVAPASVGDVTPSPKNFDVVSNKVSTLNAPKSAPDLCEGTTADALLVA